MPNTKSAERRVRSTNRKRVRNQSAKSSLKTSEKGYLATIASGKKEDSVKAYSAVASSFDKAAKTGVIHKRTADRKKSRLAKRLAIAIK